MIKNQKQAAITKEKLQDLKEAKSEFESKIINKDSAEYQLGINSFNGLIEDLENELVAYNSLSKGDMNCLRGKDFEGISDILIAARLAKKLSQKDLAELLGLKEQQIQRYELTNYETASKARLIEIVRALDIKLQFEDIQVVSSKEERKEFSYPDGVTEATVIKIAERFRNCHSMIEIAA